MQCLKLNLLYTYSHNRSFSSVLNVWEILYQFVLSSVLDMQTYDISLGLSKYLKLFSIYQCLVTICTLCLGINFPRRYKSCSPEIYLPLVENYKISTTLVLLRCWSLVMSFMFCFCMVFIFTYIVWFMKENLLTAPLHEV